jgi:hypothetical protein
MKIYFELVRHQDGRYVVCEGYTYMTLDGDRIWEGDPSTDPHALTETLAEIRESFESFRYRHNIPKTWPRGAAVVFCEAWT